MAFTALTAAQVDADSPLDSTLFGTMKANFDDHETRIATGEAGGFPVGDNSVTPAKLSAQAAGDYLMINNSALKSTGSTTYAKVKEIKVAKSGTYRVKFTLTANGGTGPQAYGRIYKNGAAVGTERTTTTSATYSEDISSISAGDLIQIYAKKTVDTGSAEISDFKLCGLTPGDFGYDETY